MTIEYKKNRVLLHDVVGVEEAEGLLEWLYKRPAAKVDFSDCVHVHPANLQALAILHPKIVEWPEDVAFAAWLKSALVEREERQEQEIYD